MLRTFDLLAGPLLGAALLGCFGGGAAGAATDASGATTQPSTDCPRVCARLATLCGAALG